MRSRHFVREHSSKRYLRVFNVSCTSKVAAGIRWHASKRLNREGRNVLYTSAPLCRRIDCIGQKRRAIFAPEEREREKKNREGTETEKIISWIIVVNTDESLIDFFPTCLEATRKKFARECADRTDCLSFFLSSRWRRCYISPCNQRRGSRGDE